MRGRLLNPPVSTSERSLRAHQTITLSLLFLAGVVNFFDRSSLSIANTTVRAELHLSATQMGWLLSAFSLAYGVAQLPLIGLLDRLTTRSVLGVGLGVWSGAQLLTGLVTGFPLFVALRVLLGVGEAPFYPTAVRSMREWFSSRTRGRATGLMSSSQAFGLALAPPVLTGLMIHTGWRAMFMVLGAAGLPVALLWVLLHRSRGSTSYSDELSGPRPQRILSTLLCQRTAWGMMLGFGGINYTAWLYIAWLPGYLETGRHLTLAKSGWLAAIPFLAGACGMLLSGVSADWFSGRGTEVGKVHRIHLVAGMLLSAGCTLVVSHAQTHAEAITVISLAFFFIQFAGTSGWGYVQSVSPPGYVASLGALQNFASFVIASAAPVVTGAIVDRTHSFTLAFAVCGAVTLLGALSYATLAAPSGMRIRT